MRFVLAIPAFLSALVLAAHFLRSQQHMLMGISLAIAVLVFSRTIWVRRIAQISLLAGALIWLWTMVDIAHARADAGRDALRMIIILSGVSLWTLLSALLLSVGTSRCKVEIAAEPRSA